MNFQILLSRPLTVLEGEQESQKSCVARQPETNCRASWRGFFFLVLAAFALVVSSSPAAIADNAPGGLPPGRSRLGNDSAIRADYVGDEACASCHQEMVRAYHQTAHYLTLRLPTKDSIIGKFNPGANILTTVDTNLFFQMDATDAGFFQKAVRRISSSEVTQRTERIDLIIGAGRQAQHYAFWKNGQLFSLPVGFRVELDSWVNMPGYHDGAAYFDRRIGTRCLECHTSSFTTLAPPFNQFIAPDSLKVGITCEKCHGPGSEHITRFRSQSPPKLSSEIAIINPKTLSRERQNDVCGICHAGIGKPLTPPLSFVPGDVLEKHLLFPESDSSVQVDVHGQQIPAMGKSRCFQSSKTMTCTTCHDVHKSQRDLTSFAANCLVCHKIESCGLFAKRGREIDGQCVACHMPVQESAVVVIEVKGKKLHPKFRNHQIGIYPDVDLP